MNRISPLRQYFPEGPCTDIACSTVVTHSGWLFLQTRFHDVHIRKCFRRILLFSRKRFRRIPPFPLYLRGSASWGCFKGGSFPNLGLQDRHGSQTDSRRRAQCVDSRV